MGQTHETQYSSVQWERYVMERLTVYRCRRCGLLYAHHRGRVVVRCSVCEERLVRVVGTLMTGNTSGDEQEGAIRAEGTRTP